MAPALKIVSECHTFVHGSNSYYIVHINMVYAYTVRSEQCQESLFNGPETGAHIPHGKLFAAMEWAIHRKVMLLYFASERGCMRVKRNEIAIALSGQVIVAAHPRHTANRVPNDGRPSAFASFVVHREHKWICTGQTGCHLLHAHVIHIGNSYHTRICIHIHIIAMCISEMPINKSEHTLWPGHGQCWPIAVVRELQCDS